MLERNIIMLSSNDRTYLVLKINNQMLRPYGSPLVFWMLPVGSFNRRLIQQTDRTSPCELQLEFYIIIYNYK